MDWNLYSFVVRGRNRKRVLLAFNKPMTPTEIKEKTKVSLSHISHALRILKSKKLVKCINEKAKVGRIYKLTPIGKDIVKEIQK